MVDLPLPLSPMSETTSPGSTPNVTSLTACRAAAAERAHAVGLVDARQPQHAHHATFQQAT